MTRWPSGRPTGRTLAHRQFSAHSQRHERSRHASKADAVMAQLPLAPVRKSPARDGVLPLR